MMGFCSYSYLRLDIIRRPLRPNMGYQPQTLFDHVAIEVDFIIHKISNPWRWHTDIHGWSPGQDINYNEFKEGISPKQTRRGPIPFASMLVIHMHTMAGHSETVRCFSDYPSHVLCMFPNALCGVQSIKLPTHFQWNGINDRTMMVMMMMMPIIIIPILKTILSIKWW